ncbi:MAG: ABC-type transport auxiliary lipoprotein family protein [Candidatus Acidiferrales bacterium]
MNNQRRRWGAILLLAAGLAGVACGGSRPQHYTVAYTPASSGAAGNSTSQVGVAVPRASHLLRQDRIVYFTTDNQLNFYAHHRWAEPPNRLVQSLLIRELRATNAFDDIVAYRAQKGLDYVLRGNLLSMEEVDTASDI